jgi:hypothetical protein
MLWVISDIGFQLPIGNRSEMAATKLLRFSVLVFTFVVN